jgi:hypothetical protein
VGDEEKVRIDDVGFGSAATLTLSIGVCFCTLPKKRAVGKVGHA